MQSDAYDDFDAEAERPSRLAGLKTLVSTALGAVLAMALLVALGVWFYRLGVRDAQNVPIIRAAVEPAKERPSDPGGLVTPHQEIRSYEVAEEDRSQASAVVLAPKPPEPDVDDLAMGEMTPAPRPERVAAVPVPPQSPAAPEIGGRTPGAGGQPEATEAAAARAPAAEDRAGPDGETPETSDPETQPAPVVTGGTEHAPARSPVARARPADLRERSAQAEQLDRERASDLVARAAASNVQIQLAADPDEAVIRLMWSRIQRENGDLLRDRALAVQTTVSGGVTFFRLRVGPFRDGSEARSICQALKARGQDCIVARNS